MDDNPELMTITETEYEKMADEIARLRTALENAAGFITGRSERYDGLAHIVIGQAKKALEQS